MGKRNVSTLYEMVYLRCGGGLRQSFSTKKRMQWEEKRYVFYSQRQSSCFEKHLCVEEIKKAGKGKECRSQQQICKGGMRTSDNLRTTQYQMPN